MNKQINVCLMGVSEREKRKKGTESLFGEIMTTNFGNLREHIKEAQQTLMRINPKRPTNFPL